MPKLIPKTGTSVSAYVAERLEDRPVAAEHEAEVGLLRRLVDDARGPSQPSPCFRSSSAVGDTAVQPCALGRLDRRAQRGRGLLRLGVGEDDRRPRPRRAPRRRRSRLRRLRSRPRRRRALALGAAPDERLAVALRAGQARRRESRTREPERLAPRRRRARSASRRSAGDRDDAARDAAAAELELGLDQREDLAARRQARRRRPAAPWRAR